MAFDIDFTMYYFVCHKFKHSPFRTKMFKIAGLPHFSGFLVIIKILVERTNGSISVWSYKTDGLYIEVTIKTGLNV